MSIWFPPEVYHKREGYAVGKVQFSDFGNDFQLRCTKPALAQRRIWLRPVLPVQHRAQEQIMDTELGTLAKTSFDSLAKSIYTLIAKLWGERFCQEVAHRMGQDFGCHANKEAGEGT